MGVAIGSSIQIALFVTPLLVILGWILGKPMDLHFETCKFPMAPGSRHICTNSVTLVETVAFALSVLIVIYTVTDGKSNYLEGAMVRKYEVKALMDSLLTLCLVDRPLCYHRIGLLRHTERGVREGAYAH